MSTHPQYGITVAPHSRALGHERTATHLLTHNEWNGMPEMFSYGSNETGVRRIVNGEVVNDSFELIQHNWHDWQKAGEVIKRLLAKGRDTRRIADVLEFIKERRWTNRISGAVPQ